MCLQDYVIHISQFGAQGDGYWNNEHFIAQLRNTIKIAEFQYPLSGYDVVFLFDHSFGYSAYTEDAVLVHKVNVSNGGKTAIFTWYHRLQRTVTEDRIQKGMKTVLEEHGINVNPYNPENWIWYVCLNKTTITLDLYFQSLLI